MKTSRLIRAFGRSSKGSRARDMTLLEKMADDPLATVSGIFVISSMLGFGHLYFNWEEYGKKYAEDYYDKGGNMQPYVPQEMRSEYIEKVKRDMKKKRKEENN